MSNSKQFMYVVSWRECASHRKLTTHTCSQADDDDLDDLSFGGPTSAADSRPLNSGSQSNSGNVPVPNPLGGRIGSTASGGRREDWGGVRTETRFTGESTLDEPVSVTIVSLRILHGSLLSEMLRFSRMLDRCETFPPSMPNYYRSFILRNKVEAMNSFGMSMQ